MNNATPEGKPVGNRFNSMTNGGGGGVAYLILEPKLLQVVNPVFSAPSPNSDQGWRTLYPGWETKGHMVPLGLFASGHAARGRTYVCCNPRLELMTQRRQAASSRRGFRTNRRKRLSDTRLRCCRMRGVDSSSYTFHSRRKGTDGLINHLLSVFNKWRRTHVSRANEGCVLRPQTNISIGDSPMRACCTGRLSNEGPQHQ